MATVAVEEFDSKGNLIGTATFSTSSDEDNRITLTQRAQAALAANASYLAIASPTAAQTTAQVQVPDQRRSRVRLLLGLLDDVSGT